jgi:hypothetical protein
MNTGTPPFSFLMPAKLSMTLLAGNIRWHRYWLECGHAATLRSTPRPIKFIFCRECADAWAEVKDHEDSLADRLDITDAGYAVLAAADVGGFAAFIADMPMGDSQ